MWVISTQCSYISTTLVAPVTQLTRRAKSRVRRSPCNATFVKTNTMPEAPTPCVRSTSSMSSPMKHLMTRTSLKSSAMQCGQQLEMDLNIAFGIREEGGLIRKHVVVVVVFVAIVVHISSSIVSAFPYVLLLLLFSL